MKGIKRKDSQPTCFGLNSEVVNFDAFDSINAYDPNHDRASYLINSKDSSVIHLGSTENLRLKSSIMTKSIPATRKNGAVMSSLINISSKEAYKKLNYQMKSKGTERIVSASKSNRSHSGKKDK